MDAAIRSAVLDRLATIADGVILTSQAAAMQESIGGRGRPEWAADDRRWCAAECAMAERVARWYWQTFNPGA